MKAVVLNGAGNVTLVEKAIPVPGNGEVLIKVKYCGICGSDIHAYETGFFPPGMVLGHEYIGEVVKLGEKVTALKAGDIVCGNNMIPCGSCHYCNAGRKNICPDMQRIGVFQDGAMAEYLTVPDDSLIKFTGKNIQAATLAEPLSVALHGVAIAGIKRNDERPCVILGAGTIGLCVLAALKAKGIRQIIILEKDARRGEIASIMGATLVFDPLAGDTAGKVSRALEERKEGVFFECAGNPAAIECAVDLVSQGGTIVIMSICEKPVELNFLRLVTGEIRILTSCGKTPGDFATSVDFLALDKTDFSPLISVVKGLEKVPQTLATLASGENKALKVFISV